jgi:hypothetical protein
VQPQMPGARVFGVLVGDATEPRVAYLSADTAAELRQLPDLGQIGASEALRIAARCQESRCAHYNAARCTPAQRIVESPPEVVSTLPACTIRSTCRWYQEEGRSACLRCPQIVTIDFRPNHARAQVVSPPA